MDAEAAIRKARLQKQKAVLAKRAALVSGIQKKHKKVRTSPYFRRPKSLEFKSVPKYPRKSVPSKPELNQVCRLLYFTLSIAFHSLLFVVFHSVIYLNSLFYFCDLISFFTSYILFTSFLLIV
jgi:hypothetical protein